MMFVLVISCLMLGGSLGQNWRDGSKDSSRANMGFYVVNMTCNEAGSHCVACYDALAEGRVYLHSVEYLNGPTYKFQFKGSAGVRSWKQYVIQDRASEPFRYCMEQSTPVDWGYVGESWRFSICMDNMMSNFPVPSECVRPVAVVSMISARGDRESHGEQSLYCATP